MHDRSVLEIQRGIYDIIMQITNITHRHRHRRRGSQVVEFALVTPILLVMGLGICEYGFMLKCNHIVSNAARDAVRMAGLGDDPDTINTSITNEISGVKNADRATSSLTWKMDNESTYSHTVGRVADPANAGKFINDAPHGSMLKLSVSVPYSPITVFFPFAQNKIIKTDAYMRRE